MTSILTNAGAIGALQILRDISSRMGEAQSQVSSGLRVGQASDNAAYWSIATTMDSDNMALSAVDDALGLGAAKVDTAYAGMESAVDIISEMKSKIVVAMEDGVDRAKVQSEIEQLKDQLAAVVASASFSGENWLSTDGNATASVVASAVRDKSGSFGVRKISVDLSSIALFTSAGDGLLEKDPLIGTSRTFGGFENISAPEDGITYTSPFTMHDGDEFQFDAQDGGAFYTVTVTKSHFDANAGPDGLVNDIEFWSLLVDASVDVGLYFYGITTDKTRAYGDDAPNPVIFSNFRITGTPAEQTIMDVDVTAEDDLGVLLSRVEGWLEMTVNAAANLGAISSRVSMQSEFVGRLSDSISSGIGRLVDADMDEASTRLKALQAQEQLAIQSLSIANTSADGILTLFR
jgi:Flagellin and related hook-associated proteins